MDTEYERLLQTALAAARAAVEVHRRNLGRVHVGEWSEKGVADFVTHVDREAEDRIGDVIRQRFPSHSILAEEGATAVARSPGDAAASATEHALSEHALSEHAKSEPAVSEQVMPEQAMFAQPAIQQAATEHAAADFAAAEWLWIVDPLDGTTNFLHGYPMYTASVAVLRAGEPVAGAVISGATGEEWTAVRGGGAFKDGQRIHASQIERLSHSLIGTGFPFKTKHELPRYLRQLDAVLRRTSGVRRGGSAALDLCHLATGYLDGFWELTLAPWDFAAGALMVREAGGVISAADGGALDLLSRGSVLAGNPVIYSRLGELLRSVE